MTNLHNGLRWWNRLMRDEIAETLSSTSKATGAIVGDLVGVVAGAAAIGQAVPVPQQRVDERRIRSRAGRLGLGAYPARQS